MKKYPCHHAHPPATQASDISRRDFLKVAGTLAGGLVLASCGPATLSSPVTTPAPIALPTVMPGVMPTQVAIARATSYDLKLVRQQMVTLFDRLGGLHDVVKTGDKVAIKVNLTGGTGVQPPTGTTAIETYITHPVVARALTELLRDAGAKEIYIVEAIYEWASYQDWGYVAVAHDLGAKLIDLNDTQPYADYASLPVGPGWFIYEKFTANHILEEVDALVSVAKMKCHWFCGITQSMKNLVGVVPAKLYGDVYRSDLHGAENETKYRLPRVVVDLNRARPINLSLIDGIKTVDGSEGPWNQDLSPKTPGLLIGGKNPIATDAVAVAAMGFDPTADYPAAPFLRADNHLNIAHQLGLGSNRLADITVVGTPLDEVKQQFRPAYGPTGFLPTLPRS